MRTLSEHIKNNQFTPVYLLYGEEEYLKNLYKKKLKNAIIDSEDDMNYSYFEGKGIDVSKIIGIAQTLPFFSEHRVILIENSGFFKNQSELADYIKTMPESTHIIFVEAEVDKRNRLYKAVKDIGTIAVLDGASDKDLKVWVASVLKQNGKKITSASADYFLSKVGSNMENISRELEKLICYAMDREEIKNSDIDAVSTVQIENQIFKMIDAIGGKRQKEALDLYYDLLALKEKPISILFLITRHFKILLHVKSLAKKKEPNAAVAKKVGIPPFTVAKYLSQSKNFHTSVLRQAVEDCALTEEQIKTGRMMDQLGIELFIVKYSKK